MKNLITSLALLLALSTASFAKEAKPEESAKEEEYTPLVFASLNAGMMGSFRYASEGFQPTWGARIGVNAIHTSIGIIAPVFAYQSTGLDFGIFGSDTEEYNLQVLLRRVAHSGLYVGVQIGGAQQTLTSDFWGDKTSTTSPMKLVYGGIVGYEFFADHLFSFGPEIQLNSLNGQAVNKTVINLTINL